MTKRAAVEDLEVFWETLQGPMGALLREAGVVMARRMSERGVEWSDLSDMQVLDLFHAAFLQVAPATYPQLPAAEVEEAVRVAFADIAMQLAANAEVGDSKH